jgi:hypothetical protein
MTARRLGADRLLLRRMVGNRHRHRSRSDHRSSIRRVL